MSFVTIDLIGRTGNQMFQIATAIAYSLKHNVPYKIPEFSLNREQWPLLFTHFPKLTQEDKDKLMNLYREPADFTFNEVPYMPNLKLHGYFQCEDHFKEYRKEIIDAFKLPYLHLPGTVAVHIRRGDYVKLAHKHPPVSVKYVNEALKLFPTEKIVFFSDDIEWCKENFKNSRYRFHPNIGAIEDMAAMSWHANQIISNSTYSWWAAWLNQYPDKKVVCPAQWFGEGNKGLKSYWICPKEWIKI